MRHDQSVTVFYDERVLGHRPDVENPFLPGRLKRRVREVVVAGGEAPEPQESSPAEVETARCFHKDAFKE